MNCIKRGWLYTTRKKGKSFLLFCILFLIAVFVLSALAIDKASSLAQDNLRKSLGGEFTIGYDYSEANPYLNVEAVDGGTIMYSTQQITPELIEEISKIKGVQYCSATTETLTAFSTIDFFKGNIPIEEEFRNTTKILGVWKSEENKHFTSKQIHLVEGRHITPQDKGKVILSKDLAVKNQVQVGDILKTDKGIDLEIVGLFQQNETESINEQVTSYDKIQNLMIADLATLIALENSPAIQGFNEMTVSISDPQSMQKIISTIKDIKTVDWKGFSIIENNENYDKATSSLQQISNLVSTFLVIIFIVSVIILSLILTMWSRTRVHETGILLSVGIRKTSIISQYITEVLLIAVIAFFLSYFPATVVADQVGSYLQNAPEQIEISEDTEGLVADNRNGTSDDVSDKTITVPDLDIQVQSEEMVMLFILGIGIVVISAGISSISTMRLKPREILTKMS